MVAEDKRLKTGLRSTKQCVLSSWSKGELTLALLNHAVFHLVGRVENVQGPVVVGNDDHTRTVFVGHPPEKLHHLPAAMAVQGGRGLVGQHDAWLFGQRPGDCDPLLLAARQHGGLVVGAPPG